MNGYIVKGIGGFYYVRTEAGIIECKPRGIFRKQKITPVAGDEVTVETENGASVIAEIAPRKNVFVRPPVANLDVLFLVASTTQPTPSTLVLDKLSAIAVDKGIKISTSWGYLAVVVGCALMILRCLVSSKQSLVLLIKGKPEEPAEEEGGADA